MADLENLLLQAAGRTEAPERKNKSHVHSRWRRERSGSNESKEDDSGNPKFNKRKHSGSKIPQNKNLRGPLEKDEMGRWVNGKTNRSNGDESDSSPSIGSDLYKDEADKEELSKLSELDRERILADRSGKIDDYCLKKKAKASLTEEERAENENPPPFHSHGRSSVRAEKQTDALNELRAKRMRHQEPELYRRLRAAVSSSSANKDFIPVPELDSSGSDDEKEDKLPDDTDLDDNLDDVLSSPSREIRYEDARQVTIRRSKLAKWFMEPFFEDIIVGCFVRVGIGRSSKGPKYRLCVVKNVDSSDLTRQYKLEGRTTGKWLNCVWGSEASAARWQMAMVSDSLPTEEEFNEWLSEMERIGAQIPCRQDVDDKKEEIQKSGAFVYSADTVKKMLKQKKSTCSRPLNFAVEKAILKKEIAVAENSEKEIEAEMLRARLKNMEELSRQANPADARAIRLLEMNRKNRTENYRNASEAKPVDLNLKAGDSGYDPFSRRWTRPQCYDSYEAETKPDLKDGEEANREAIEKAGGEGKLIDTRAPVDYGAELYSLHDFDLPISLDGLNKFNGVEGVQLGFMERKRKIESTIGHRVPHDNGRRHALTLSISDYKRRRGLL